MKSIKVKLYDHEFERTAEQTAVDCLGFLAAVALTATLWALIIMTG